jgi:hypothetical protein
VDPVRKEDQFTGGSRCDEFRHLHCFHGIGMGNFFLNASRNAAVFSHDLLYAFRLWLDTRKAELRNMLEYARKTFPYW